MIETFLHFNKKHALFDSDDKILLAVSGGLDSVVMTDLFFQAGFKFSIAHCNFHLRGAASDQDAAFVKKLAQSYKSELFLKDFDTLAVAARDQVSVEMAARELRYAWFDQLLRVNDFKWLATAHHKNDNLETILFNLVKGTGLAGLRGIPPKRAMVIRPLLFATRHQLEQYAHQRQLKWRQDQSNQDLKISRNLIRHKVIPQLEKINPSLLQTLDSTIERMVAAEHVWIQQVNAFKKKYTSRRGDHYWIQKKPLVKEREAQVLLFELIRQFGFNLDQSRDIIASIDQPGKMFYASGYVLNIDREAVLVSVRAPDLEEQSIDGPDQKEWIKGSVRLQMEVVNAELLSMSRDSQVAQLDFDKLHFPLKIRSWKEGDWFIPLGLSGKKKISDFMIDKKIPVNLKKRIILLLSGKDIVWVIGHRIDERYKVTPATRNIYRIKYFSHDQSL
ncbi:MAG: tRNA lysidine(34) synthetase TilS [Candidatus Cyclobacteriaceae bacterium M3_2C_046]